MLCGTGNKGHLIIVPGHNGAQKILGNDQIPVDLAALQGALRLFLRHFFYRTCIPGRIHLLQQRNPAFYKLILCISYNGKPDFLSAVILCRSLCLDNRQKPDNPCKNQRCYKKERERSAHPFDL